MSAPPAIRTTARLLVPLLALAAALGCGGQSAELRAARGSGYKADFAVVFNHVVAVVRSRFKHFPDKVEENAAAGTIETAWIQVRTTTQGSEDHTTSQQQRDAQTAQDQATGNAPMFKTSGNERIIYMVRYQVYVVGGNPWRVVVRGRAAKFTEGDRLHVELKGADEPSWLTGRVEAMEVDIYRRLKRYAVPVQEPTAGGDRPPPVPADLARYGKIPRAAAERIEEVRRAAGDRDFARLRTLMADDFEWSLGAEPDAEQALATWQADGSSLGALVETLERGCRAESETRVTCPPEFSEQVGYLGYRAAFERRNDTWKMTSFVTGD